MKRENFEKYLEKMVEITLFDGSIYKGCLRKSHNEIFKNDANLYKPINRYFVTTDKESKICISCVFKVSHVKTIRL